MSGPILAERKAEAAGQFSLFGGDSGVTEVDESVLDGEEFDKRTLLREEKEVLGQFVTDHPLLGVQAILAAQTTHEMGELDDLGDGDLVTIGGIIGAVQRKYTKRSEPYAQFRLEGLAGGAQVIAFPSSTRRCPELIESDRIVLVSGRIDLRGRELQIRANEVREPNLGAAASPGARRPRGRPPRRGVHAGGPGQGEGAPRVRIRAARGPGPLPFLERRDARRGRERPGRPVGSLLGELHSLLGVGAARVGDDALLTRPKNPAGRVLGMAFQVIPAIDVAAGGSPG